MPNTTSAKKALRQANRKRQHNLYWKRKMKIAIKNIRGQLQDKKVSIDIIKKEESLLYRVVDKAAKEKVIHKNKAKRVKSKISKQVSVHEKSLNKHKESVKKPTKKDTKNKKSEKSARGRKSKSKSS